MLAIAAILLTGGAFAATKVGWIQNDSSSTKAKSQSSQPQKHTPKTPESYDTTCASKKTIEKRTPVLLVHGWNGSPTMWVDARMLRALEGPSNFLTTFDYSRFNQAWVTHPALGSALSQKINCLADASRAGGGKGKVIIVAHSMGGLVAKRALALGGAGKHVDRVYTLGTPYEGSGLGSAADAFTRSHCRRVDPRSASCPPTAFEGLAEFNDLVKKLPKWPSHTSVMAIAGNVKTRSPEMVLAGDGIVSTSSAMAGGRLPGQGGGELVYNCVGEAFAPLEAPCAHGNLPNYKPIQEQIRKSIERYLNPPKRVLSYGGLTIPLRSSWKITERSAEAAAVTDTRCDDADACTFYVYSPQHPPYMTDTPEKVLMCGGETRLEYIGTNTIGGGKAFAYRFDGYSGDDLWWFVPSKKIVISGNVEGLASALERAHWS